ncbi:MAG: ABC transporter ATP-binding protein [Hyphomicrobiaceae bacterium]
MAERIDHDMPIAPVTGAASAVAAGMANAVMQAPLRPPGPALGTASLPTAMVASATAATVITPRPQANGAGPASHSGPRKASTDPRDVVLEVRDLKKHFPVKKGLLRKTVGHVYAVDGVSFTINKGETLGLVGESGCGKTTVGRTLLRLVEPTSGEILLEGKDVSKLSKAELRPYRREMQIIFQDPFSSLDPRMSAGNIVGEPLMVHGVGNAEERRQKVAEIFARVGLRPQQMDNFPHQFSGGQRQRIGIARALALNPKLIIGDEPVSALDVSIQAQVINILMDLQKDLGLSYLFISHNLAVVEHISHRIAVMYLGRIVEYADKRTLFTAPKHPYTEALLSAVPVPDPSIRRKKLVIDGDVPSPVKPPPGCHFHTRCPFAEARCKVEAPKLKDVGNGQLVACHLR